MQAATHRHGHDNQSKPTQADQCKKEEQGTTMQHEPSMRRTGFWYYQRDARDFYLGTRSQVFVAALIFINFGITVIQAQIDPFGGSERGKYNTTWTILDAIFTAFFTCELVLNMYGSWCKPFWRSGWNVFDFVVVCVSILVLTWEDMPGELQLIKLLRAFRVFRLFNRIPSMRKILQSLGKAVPGMVSAFGINILMMSIYSVLAVDLFKDLYEQDCDGTLESQNPHKMSKTARGYCYGWDYYGNFGRAWYTLFQVLTGESWSEAAVRPIMYFFEREENSLYWCLTCFFFLSFIVINALVLLNVVVALLMDGMNGGDAESDSSEEEEEETSEEIGDAEPQDLQRQLNTLTEQVTNQQQQLTTMFKMLEDIRANGVALRENGNHFGVDIDDATTTHATVTEAKARSL